MAEPEIRQLAPEDLPSTDREVTETELEGVSGGSAGDGFALIENSVMDALNPTLFDH